MDPLHNDQICDVPEDVMQGMKDMGIFGLQVPEELEGLGLNNTQYARLSEVNPFPQYLISPMYLV